MRWTYLDSLSIWCMYSFLFPFNTIHKSGPERPSSLLAKCCPEVWSLLLCTDLFETWDKWFFWSSVALQTLWTVCFPLMGTLSSPYFLVQGNLTTWRLLLLGWAIAIYFLNAGKSSKDYSCCCYYLVGLLQYTLQWGWLWRSQGSCGPEGSGLCAKWCLLLKATAVL